MNKRNVTIKKTAGQRINELQHDCCQLYFLIGAITDCLDKLPTPTRLYFIELLDQKAARTDDEYKATINTLIEVLEK